jgi:peptidoglycan/LPS O-acetylase OafA/YrhL
MKLAAKGTGRNKSVEGLRGFAATSVLAYHVYMMGRTGKLVPEMNSDFAPYFLGLGHFAVLIFFCISGLLIVQSLVQHHDWRVFARNRVVRIYPVFGILHLIMFTLGPLAGYEWMGLIKHNPALYARDFISNLIFLPGVFHLPLAQKNAWSLSYEAVFYTLACVIFVGFQKRAQGKISGNLLLAIGVSATLVALFFRNDFFFFALGATTFGLLTQNRLPSMPGGPTGLISLIAAFVAYRFNLFLGLALLIPFFLTVVTEKGWFSDFLRTPPLQHLGKVSYSMYLVSPFVMEALRFICVKLATKVGNGPAFITFGVASFVVCPIVATASFELVERRLTKKLFPGPKPLPATQSAA